MRHPLPQLSLSELLPFQNDTGDLAVVLYCRFDGSNKSDSRQYDYATVAAVAGSFLQWNLFDDAWKKTCKDMGADGLHTTDAAVGNTPYSLNEGWDRTRIDKFVDALITVAFDRMARPITDYDPGNMGLFVYTVTINLKDYIRAKQSVSVIPTADEILATESLNACFKFGRDFTDSQYYHLVYDQNEPFRGHVLDRQKKRKAVETWPMFGDIISNTQANSRFVPALQLADLFAYCYSHKRDKGQKFPWEARVLSFPIEEAYADYQRLINPRKQTLALAQSMRFPPRTPTR
jgi:hypothetical protein